MASGAGPSTGGHGSDAWEIQENDYVQRLLLQFGGGMDDPPPFSQIDPLLGPEIFADLPELMEAELAAAAGSDGGQRGGVAGPPDLTPAGRGGAGAGAGSGKRKAQELRADDDDDFDDGEPVRGGRRQPQSEAAKLKACREKQRRERLNEKFQELAAAVNLDHNSRGDRLMILTDAIRVLTQLKQENGQLKELNKYLQERIVKYESTSSYHMFQMHQAQQLQLQREFALRHAATRAGGTKGNDEGTTTAVVGAGGGGAGGEAAAPPAVAPPAAPPSAAPSAPADLAKDPSALAALLSAHPLAGLMGHPIAGLMGAGPGAAMGLAALQQQLRTASALGAAGSDANPLGALMAQLAGAGAGSLFGNEGPQDHTLRPPAA